MECVQCGTYVPAADAIEVVNEWDNSHPVLCSKQCLKALKKEIGAKYIIEE